MNTTLAIHNGSQGDDESEMLYTDEDNEVGTDEYDESADNDWVLNELVIECFVMADWLLIQH